MRADKASLKEMHTLLVRLQEKAALNAQLQMQLEQKDQFLQELKDERNRLEDENRVSRLSL